MQLVGAMGQRSSMTHIIDVFRGSLNQQVCVGLPKSIGRSGMIFHVFKRFHVIIRCFAHLVNYYPKRLVLDSLEVVLSSIEIGYFSNAQINVLTIFVLLG